MDSPRRTRSSYPAQAGYPVRRGLSVRSLLPPEYWVTRPSAQLRTRRVMTAEDDATSRSRDSICPRLAIEFPYPPNRGRRECRVHAAPAVSCAIGAKKYAHEHTGSAEASDIPCAMALRLISRSPRRAGLVVTVISGIASTNLTPASGRQDHATLPYASVPHVKGTSASTASHPALVTIAKRPSYRDGTKSIYC